MCRVFGPEDGMPVEQEVTESAATNCCHQGDDDHAEPVEVLASGGEGTAGSEHGYPEHTEQIEHS